MTTCRFCGEMVLTKPEKLVSIESVAIIDFLDTLDENAIDLDDNDPHKLICKKCEVTAKGYQAFIDKIRGTQYKLRVSKMNKKRPMPKILPVADNNKRVKQQGDSQIVRIIGECTLRRLPLVEKEPDVIENVIEDEEDDYRGESSQSSSQEGYYTCRDCGATFAEGPIFVAHLETCLQLPICPICGYECAAHNLLSLHLLHCHDLAFT